MSRCPRDGLGRSECAELIRAGLAESGQMVTGQDCEVTVSATRPLVMNEWIRGYTCPHGVTYWFEPTTDQIATWNARQWPPRRPE
jgi:hypothetical protein